MRLEVASYLNVTFTRFCLAIIAVVTSSVIGTQAQEPTPTATPQIPSQPVATMVEVIVTGSNIPTAEEVGPQPVDTYRKADLERLGARSVTDFVQKLPVATGPSTNENVNTIGDGRTDIDLRGLGAKETLVLQDGRRLAPDGFAGYYSDLNAFFGGTVDLNLFPFGLIDHIDILKDGASAIYGSDAVGGVFNVWLIHRFRGLEIYASYGNTNLGASNDQGEERAYLLAGTGDDKTDIVVYAEVYNRAAIYDRDRDISSNADFTRFGGPDNRSGDFAGRVGDFVYQPGLNRGAGSPTRHAFPDVANDPQYVPLSSLPRAQQLFNYAALTPAMAPVDREYLYGSLDHKICEQYLELFADFKYVRSFWDGVLAPAPLSKQLLFSSTLDVFTDAKHPFGISGVNNGISVPIQNPFNPFTVADYTSPNIPGNQKVMCLPERRSRPACVTVRDCVPTRLQPITTSSPAASMVIWRSSVITLRLGTGKAGSAIAKISAPSALAGSWITMRCAQRYSTQIRRPPSIHLALTRTRPR